MTLESLTHIAIEIRQFFRHLFGSRMASHLETSLLQLRADYDFRLRDRDQYILDLKDDATRLRARVTELEMVLIPLISGGLLGGPSRRAAPPTFEPVIEPNSWRAEQDRFYAAQAEELVAETAKSKEQQ